MKNRLTALLLCIGFILPMGCDVGSSGIQADPPADSSQISSEADVPANDDPAGADSSISDSSSSSQRDTQRPASPTNARAYRRSTTSGELFWNSAIDNIAVIGYEIIRDGLVISSRETTNLVDTQLTPGQPYGYKIVAIDAAGNRSTPVSVILDGNPPVPQLNLSIDRERAALDEGNSDGASFVVSIDTNATEPVRLSVWPESPEFSNDMVVELSATELQSGSQQATVGFKLFIGMQPLLPQERKFVVSVTSGELTRESRITLDVKPVNAPDVYLLIGQSNMVGSSEYGAKDASAGGSDALNDRIWQLNVVPNNRGLFSTFEMHVNETNNVFEPRFVKAEDPLHEPLYANIGKKGGSHIGLGLTFAKALLADTAQRVYLVPAAWGATGFCTGNQGERGWNAAPPGDDFLRGTWLAERALTRLNMTLRDTNGILRGILWHQGGADADNYACAKSYADNLRLLIQRIRREARVDARGAGARGTDAAVPFIVATQSRGSDNHSNFSNWSEPKKIVDSAHRTIASSVPYADWVNNDDFVPPAYPCGSTSCVHFGAAAYREMGQRFYQAIQRIWERR
ncbi:MAG: sialate O-acetylesterase [Granulosicoccus sp.]